MTKKSYLYDRFLVSNRNFTTDNIKIIKNSRFFQVLGSKFQVFQGKVATLLKGICGLQLNNQKVFCAPGPRTK